MTIRKHKGARNELLAICKLWDMGYEVFRNPSAHGPIDLVAVDLKTGIVRKFDIKTATHAIRKKDGKEVVYGVHQTEIQRKNGIELMYVADDGRIYMELP